MARALWTDELGLHRLQIRTGIKLAIVYLVYLSGVVTLASTYLGINIS